MKVAPKADEQIVAVCRSQTIHIGRRKARKGFVLIATSIAMTLLIGVAGLSIDVGRMYVIRSELQTFTDAAALFAALQLDGTDAGFARARTGATQLATGPHAMRWDMGTEPITNIMTSFSADSKTWDEKPKQAADARTVRVVATERAPVIFLRLFQNADSSTISAASVAAKTDQTARLIE